MVALQSLRRPEEVAELRGLTVAQVLGLDERSNGPTVDAGASDPEPAADAEPAAEAEPAADTQSASDAAAASDPVPAEAQAETEAV